MTPAFDMDRLRDVFGDAVVHDAATGAAALTHRFGDEAFLKGHFPGFPVVPGVILLDGMILAALHAFIRLTGRPAEAVCEVRVDAVAFNRPVTPGAPIEFIARPAGTAQAGRFTAKASVMAGASRHARAGVTLLIDGATAP